MAAMRPFISFVAYFAVPLLIANVRGQSIDPYPYLNGGAYSGPAVPLSPDPLVQYRWRADVNASQLQVRYVN
jgi:hypothetical protein